MGRHHTREIGEDHINSRSHDYWSTHYPITGVWQATYENHSSTTKGPAVRQDTTTTGDIYRRRLLGEYDNSRKKTDKDRTPIPQQLLELKSPALPNTKTTTTTPDWHFSPPDQPPFESKFRPNTKNTKVSETTTTSKDGSTTTWITSTSGDNTGTYSTYPEAKKSKERKRFLFSESLPEIRKPHDFRYYPNVFRFCHGGNLDMVL
eukprot:3094444-Amphidinium_carterae.1